MDEVEYILSYDCQRPNNVGTYVGMPWMITYPDVEERAVQLLLNNYTHINFI